MGKKSQRDANCTIEKALIDYCSPTLASIKTAALFTLFTPSNGGLRDWDRRLKPFGIRLCVLKKAPSFMLVYVFRPARLAEDLNSAAASALLNQCGYRSLYPKDAIKELKRRLAENEEFPHEIGLFLGYPVEDVAGFMKYGGLGYKYSGCWKVYGDKARAEAVFAGYRKCREVYGRLWRQGKSVLQLTVAV